MAKRKEVKLERAEVLRNLQLLIPTDMEAQTEAPMLVDLLLPRYKDGDCTRLPAIVKIRAQGTCWLVTIECPTEGVQTAVGLETLHDLIGQLEKALTNGRINWSETWEVQKRRRQARGD